MYGTFGVKNRDFFVGTSSKTSCFTWSRVFQASKNCYFRLLWPPGASGGSFWASWGPPGALLGLIFGLLAAPFGPPGARFEPPGASSGSFWLSWSLLGLILSLLGLILGLLGPPGSHFGLPGASFSSFFALPLLRLRVVHCHVLCVPLAPRPWLLHAGSLLGGRFGRACACWIRPPSVTLVTSCRDRGMSLRLASLQASLYPPLNPLPPGPLHSRRITPFGPQISIKSL